MRVELDVSLGLLRVIQPTDPSGTDEPYLWVYALVLDGRTLRRAPGGGLLPAVKVTRVPALAREAGASADTSGAFAPRFRLSGRVTERLRTVTRDLPGPTRLHLPGMVALLLLAWDADSSPGWAVRRAERRTREFLEEEVNARLAALDLGFLNAGDVAARLAAWQARLADLLRALARDGASAAIQETALAVMADAPWGARVIMLADPDESVGTGHAAFGEQEMIAAGRERGWSLFLSQSGRPVGGARYDVNGHALLRLRAGNDLAHRLVGRPLSVDLGPRRVAVTTRDRLCLPRGTEVTHRLRGHRQWQEVVLTYPFLAPRYRVNGVTVSGTSGTIAVPVTASFPVFDEGGHLLVGEQSAHRTVNLSFLLDRRPGEPQLTRLALVNDPTDGNYALTVEVEGLVPGKGPVPIGALSLQVWGQEIAFDGRVVERLVECQTQKVKELEILVKPRLPDDFRGIPRPNWRWERYDALVSALDRLAELGLRDRAAIEGLKAGLAARMGLVEGPAPLSPEAPPPAAPAR